MEPQPSSAAEVLEKIDEIRRYYDACERLSGTSLRITKSMLCFVLGFEDSGDIDPVLEELRRQGKLVAVVGDQVLFAPLTAVLATSPASV